LKHRQPIRAFLGAERARFVRVGLDNSKIAHQAQLSGSSHLPPSAPTRHATTLSMAVPK